jgi:hypothetical protein
VPGLGPRIVLQRPRCEVLAVCDRQCSAVATGELAIGGPDRVDGRTSTQGRDQRNRSYRYPPASAQTRAFRYTDALEGTGLETHGGLRGRNKHEHFVRDLA